MDQVSEKDDPRGLKTWEKFEVKENLLTDFSFEGEDRSKYVGTLGDLSLRQGVLKNLAMKLGVPFIDRFNKRGFMYIIFEEFEKRRQRTEIQDQQTQIQDQQTQIQDQQTQIQDQQTQIQGQQTQIEEQQTQIQDQQTQIRDLQTQIRELQSEMGVLKQTLQNLMADLEIEKNLNKLRKQDFKNTKPRGGQDSGVNVRKEDDTGLNE